MDAAECVLVETGYGAASMREIARESSMSKKTRYRLFPDKLSIFVALVLNYDFSFLDSTPTIAETGDFHAELRKALLEFSQFVLSPRQIAMTRLVIAEARHSPELTQSFYENCLNRGVQIVSDRLKNMHGSIFQKGYDVDMVADILLGAILTMAQMRTLVCDPDPAVIRRELDTRLEATLKLVLGNFSRAYTSPDFLYARLSPCLRRFYYPACVNFVSNSVC